VVAFSAWRILPVSALRLYCASTLIVGDTEIWVRGVEEVEVRATVKTYVMAAATFLPARFLYIQARGNGTRRPI
jgi:hypothetical protein